MSCATSSSFLTIKTQQYYMDESDKRLRFDRITHFDHQAQPFFAVQTVKMRLPDHKITVFALGRGRLVLNCTEVSFDTAAEP